MVLIIHLNNINLSFFLGKKEAKEEYFRYYLLSATIYVC